MDYTYRRLEYDDISEVRQLLEVFRLTFEDESYATERAPDDAYLSSLLRDPTCIVLVAQTAEGDVVGGLIAYELRKFEQVRSEIYLYDLAVNAAHRRCGIATALIGQLRTIAAGVGAWVIFVQADAVDTGAVALYTQLSCQVEDDVIHFDITVPAAAGPQG